MSNAASTADYRIEAHGSSILAMRGGVQGYGGNSFAREPLFTREGAWQVAREYMTSTYNTVKVFKGGTLVFKAFKQVDGSWIDAKSCATISL